MTLPPWLWRVLRSKKTRTAGKIGLCLAIVMAGGFYPVVNWWGKREWKKAEAEVRARGFPVRERTVKVGELRESFFCQTGYLAEAELPIEKSLGPYQEMTGELLPSMFWSAVSSGPGTITREQQAKADRKLCAPYQSRRAALVEATRRAIPVSEAATDSYVEIPVSDLTLTLRLLRFLKEDADLAKASGDLAVAEESMEAYSRILADLRSPRTIFFHKTLQRREVSQLVYWSFGDYHKLDEAQLINIDGKLAKFDYLGLARDYFRELPGDAIRVHKEILEGRLPNPRPVVVGGLFKSWSWDRKEMDRRARFLWEAWKPIGLYEVDMAHSLRELMAATEDSGAAGFERLRSSKASSAFTRYLCQQGRIVPVLDSWSRDEDHDQGQLCMARHAIAIERYRLRHGELPARLGELDGDFREGLPKDKWGSSIEYERARSDGFKLSLPRDEEFWGPGKTWSAAFPGRE